MGRVLTDRLWRARNREERSNADTDPGCLGGGGENGWSTRRHSLLYCHCASEAYQQPQRAHLPLPVRFVHRFLLVLVLLPSHFQLMLRLSNHLEAKALVEKTSAIVFHHVQGQSLSGLPRLVS